MFQKFECFGLALKCRKSRICGIFLSTAIFFANSVVNNLVLSSYVRVVITKNFFDLDSSKEELDISFIPFYEYLFKKEE
ncbi:hypothetical protein B1J93_17065 [Leptospira kirschneri serovar Pomona]|uniref:Uncharacterized protein n=1 Tax=Leptospira kirschneri serovar Pomona TaxID=561005 RepID=A0A1T1DHW4_9LEPT|nr:hypothetical protein B1J93_17065 [Leptospira kirschneri serovar Pomona]